MSLVSRFSRVVALAVTVASPAVAQEDQLAKCEKPFGILAVNEPQDQYMRVFQRYQLGSPAALLRMMAQNSKCFVVVERGVAMQNIEQERALARSGEMQQDANMGGGQMKAADFVMTAAVQVSDNNAGGMGGAVGGLLGHKAFGALGGGVKFKDAQGGYTSTAEGKVIAASYLDNFNKIVANLKGDADMMARADKFKAVGLSGADVKAGASYAEGDVLTPKIDNVKVQGSTAEGWVKKTLVSRR